MSEPAFAHAGHWLVQLAYLAPLGALGVVLVVGKVRERLERRADVARE
jgi:hypothetical protein